MFGLGRKKGFEPRGFDYVPRIWDPKKEEFEQRVADAKEKYHGQKTTQHKRVVRFNFRENDFATGGARLNKFDRRYGQVSPWRTIIILFIILALLYLIFVLEI